MHCHELASTDAGRTWALVLEDGDETVAELTAWARDRRVAAARFTAIGAFRRATLGWFDLDAKEYREIPVDEQVEVLSITGDIALGPDGDPALHAHAVVGLASGETRGGHLLAGTVRPTLEVILDETPAHLRKRTVPEYGLALIAPGA